MSASTALTKQIEYADQEGVPPRKRTANWLQGAALTTTGAVVGDVHGQLTKVDFNSESVTKKVNIFSTFTLITRNMLFPKL